MFICGLLGSYLWHVSSSPSWKPTKKHLSAVAVRLSPRLHAGSDTGVIHNLAYYMIVQSSTMSYGIV